MEEYHDIAMRGVMAFVVIFFFAPYQETIPSLWLKVGAVVCSICLVLVCVYDSAGRIYRWRHQRRPVLDGPRGRRRR